MGHSLLSLDYGTDVPLRRPTTNFGDKAYPSPPTATIRVARKLNPPRRITNDAGQEVWTQDGLLYVYRGTDIRNGDKIGLPEGDFIVLGNPELDFNQPMDGTDFGVMRLNIERG